MISDELHDEITLNNATEGSAQSLAYCYDKAIKMGLKETLCWYHYFLEFENKVKIITADGNIKGKTARTMKMLQYLPNVNSRIRTHRGKKFLMLFGGNGVGIDRIKLVTYLIILHILLVIVVRRLRI